MDAAATNSDKCIYSLQNFILNNPGPCPVFIDILADGEKIIRANAGISNTVNPETCTGVTEAWKE
jgi:hypothetical protein